MLIAFSAGCRSVETSEQQNVCRWTRRRRRANEKFLTKPIRIACGLFANTIYVLDTTATYTYVAAFSFSSHLLLPRSSLFHFSYVSIFIGRRTHVGRETFISRLSTQRKRKKFFRMNLFLKEVGSGCMLYGDACCSSRSSSGKFSKSYLRVRLTNGVK